MLTIFTQMDLFTKLLVKLHVQNGHSFLGFDVWTFLCKIWSVFQSVDLCCKILLNISVPNMLYSGRQCIALRRNSEKKIHMKGNPGTFLALLKLLAKYDEVLKSHLENPRLKNATYISPQSQNDMIDVIGKLMIQRKILEEIKLTTFYFILADEVTSPLHRTDAHLH